MFHPEQRSQRWRRNWRAGREQYKPHNHYNFPLWSSGGVFELHQETDFPALSVAAMQVRCARWGHDHNLGFRTGTDKARGTITVEYWPLDAAVTE